MNGRTFGPGLTSEGASFRLWAPAAKRVDVLLDKPHPLRRGDDGWFSADIAGVKAGARYKFRIDDEVDVPDPASGFQPDDVADPSEVIDHTAYTWRAADWRGRPWPARDAPSIGFPGIGIRTRVWRRGPDAEWRDYRSQRGMGRAPRRR